MPAQKPTRPQTRDQIVQFQSNTPDAVSRMFDDVSRLLASQARETRSQLTIDLVVGANRIVHNLGRLPKHVSLMPTVADATFAWGVSEMTERQLTITVVGVAQTGASIEVS